MVREISQYLPNHEEISRYIPDHKAFDAKVVQGIEVPWISLKLFNAKEDTTAQYIATTNSISIMDSNFEHLIYFDGLLKPLLVIKSKLQRVKRQ